jgi:uncharacterized protein (TIGR04222 family)
VNLLTSDNVTCGITGPEFLAAYGLLFLVSLFGTIVLRWWLAAVPAGVATGNLSEQPYDIAYVNGGPGLAVLSALTSMRVAGTILAQGRGRVRAGQPLGDGADELERAIHLAAVEPITRHELLTNRVVRMALDSTRQRLESAGSLLSTRQRRRIKLAALWMVAVAVLGLVRLVAGAANGAAVGYLIEELVVVGIAATILICTAPRASRRGTAQLKDLRARHPELAPRMRANWRAYGPAVAGLGVGIFGAGALWASDPALATDMAVPRHPARSRYHGAGYSAGYGGWGAGCGGGGSGCGGGGGGCGGGCGGGGGGGC